MYEIIKGVINSKDYELKDILYKINKMYIESAITEEQKTELNNLARENANAENSYASLQVQVNNIYAEIDNIKSRLNALEVTDKPTEPSETEEYPEYVQPTGAHDAYNKGRKTTYKGEKYICLIDGCVWAPDVYPQGWEKVVEEVTEEE